MSKTFMFADIFDFNDLSFPCLFGLDKNEYIRAFQYFHRIMELRSSINLIISQSNIENEILVVRGEQNLIHDFFSPRREPNRRILGPMFSVINDIRDCYIQYDFTYSKINEHNFYIKYFVNFNNSDIFIVINDLYRFIWFLVLFSYVMVYSGFMHYRLDDFRKITLCQLNIIYETSSDVIYQNIINMFMNINNENLNENKNIINIKESYKWFFRGCGCGR